MMFYNMIGGSVTERLRIDGTDGIQPLAHIVPMTDSTYNLGSNGTRFANVYADTLYGNGTNITNVNADTVDGIQGASFLRGDVDDTTVAHLTFNRSTDAKFSLSGSNDPFFIFNEGTTQKARIQWSSSGYLWLQNHEDDSVIVLRDNLGFSPDAGSTIHKIFHAGNDGSGSGLDADTLDGVQGSSFLRSDAADTCSGQINFTNTIISKKDGDRSTQGGCALVLTHNTTPALRANHFIHDDFPTGKGTYYIQVTESGVSNDRNMCLQGYGGKVKIGGSGSEPDHTLHVQGTFRTTSTSTFDGDLTLNGRLTANEGSPPATGPNHFISDDGSATTIGTAATLRVANNGGNAAFSVFEAESGSGSIRLANNGLFYVTGDTKFSNRVRTDISSTVDGFMGEAYSNYFGLKHTDQTLNSEYMIISKDDHTFISASSGSNVYIRPGGNSSSNQMIVAPTGTTIGGNLVLTTANEGSGNGLDADTLDGVQGAAYLRSNTADTASGDITFSGGAGAVTIAAASDIRFGNGTWTGESMKIQGHSNYLYIQGGSNGVRLRGSDGGDIANFANTSISLYDPVTFSGDATFNGGAGAITITSSDIRSAGSSTWTGNPGLDVGKIQMHSNRWYIVANGNSNRIVQFRVNGDDKTWIANDGQIYHGSSGTGDKYWRQGNDGSGSGLDADTLDGIQASGFFQQAGSWLGDLGSNGFTRENGVYMTGGAEFVLLSKSGQGHVLVDGDYHAYEAGGYFSYYNSNFGSQVGFYSDSTTSAVWKGHLKPSSNNSQDLGTSSVRWRNIYTNDLNLSNEGGANDVDGTWGNFTIQEGEDDLFLINKRNGKKYKFNLTEV